MTMMTCECCGRRVEDLQDFEPVFKLPDIIAALPEKDRKMMGQPGPDRRAMISTEVCVLDYDDEQSRACYLRVVIPFAVINHRLSRPLFHWGAWVEIDHDVMLDYASSAAQDVGHENAPQGEVHLQIEYEAKLANDIGRRIGERPAFMAPMRLVPRRGNERWTAYFVDLDHPLTKLQRDGVTLEQTLLWTQPLHRMTRGSDDA